MVLKSLSFPLNKMPYDSEADDMLIHKFKEAIFQYRNKQSKSSLLYRFD